MKGLDVVTGTSGRMPALRKPKSPAVAAVVGFLFGGIGLGLYLWSFVDFVIPVAIVVLGGVILKSAGVFGGAVIASAWGYFRTVDSNKKLSEATEGRNVEG